MTNKRLNAAVAVLFGLGIFVCWSSQAQENPIKVTIGFQALLVAGYST
jgi:hypothetical protein